MSTVASLIEQLKSNHKPDESIVFQYMVADFTSYLPEEFSEIANYLMNNDSFGEESAEFFQGWMSEAASVIEDEEEED